MSIDVSEFLRPMYPQSFPSLITDSAKGPAVVEESGMSGIKNLNIQRANI